MSRVAMGRESHRSNDRQSEGRISWMVRTSFSSRLTPALCGPRFAAVGAMAALSLAARLASSQTLNHAIDTREKDEPASEARYGEARYSDSPYSGSVFDEPARPLRKLGLMFDLGTMDGAMMTLVYRPLPWLRVHGGGGTNGAGPGVRIGTVVSPFRNSGWSFSADGGHFFPGNVNGLFAAFAGSDYDDSHLLEHFDYDFVNLQAGWEVERGDLMFFARGGVGLLWTQLPSDDLARIRNLSSFVDSDGSVEALLPSLKIGIIGFL
jgi:hypothetical protein